MSSLLSMFGQQGGGGMGQAGYGTQVVGYPEQGGVTNFGQNVNLGTVQTPGTGFMGGYTGTGGEGTGHLLGSLLGQGPANTLADQLGDYPHLQAAVKLLQGQMSPGAGRPGHHVGIGKHTEPTQPGQAPGHALSVSSLIDAALSYYGIGAGGGAGANAVR